MCCNIGLGVEVTQVRQNEIVFLYQMVKESSSQFLVIVIHQRGRKHRALMGKDIYDAGVKLGEFIFVQYLSPVGNPFEDVTEVVVAKEFLDFLHHTA